MSKHISLKYSLIYLGIPLFLALFSLPAINILTSVVLNREEAARLAQLGITTNSQLDLMYGKLVLIKHLILDLSISSLVSILGGAIIKYILVTTGQKYLILGAAILILLTVSLQMVSSLLFYQTTWIEIALELTMVLGLFPLIIIATNLYISKLKKHYS